jgi:hypothetical protein
LTHTGPLCAQLLQSGIIDGKNVVQTTNEAEADMVVTDQIPSGRVTRRTLLLCPDGKAGQIRASTKHLKGADKLTVLSVSASIAHIQAIAA